MALVGLALAVTACSDAGSDDAAGTTVPGAPTSTGVATSGPAPTVTEASAPVSPDALRGVRYCEVLLLHLGEDGIVADVWNTMGHSECPADAWAELDAAAIAEDNDALVALLNGPRYWTLDAIEATMQIEAPVTMFGRIEMFLAATVQLGPKLPDQTPYIGREVVRDTVFVFHAGTEIYELTDPDGVHYVMQSYSQTVDPTMDASRLAALGEILQLPEGWRFDVITLDDELEVYDTDGIAVVVQDEFQNTYQRIDPPAV